MKNMQRKMSKPVKRAKAVNIEVKRTIDEYPDLSFLRTTPEYHYGKDGSNWIHVSEEDRQNEIAKYGSIWNACIEYAKQDKERMDAYIRGEWDMIGIKAVATIHIPIRDNDTKIQTIDSGYLWGIESDSDNSHLQEIEKERIDEVKECLRVLYVEDADSCKIVTI